MRTIDKILPPTDGCQMIVYNGTNHFKYLRYKPSTVISTFPTITEKYATLQDDINSTTRVDKQFSLRDLDSIVPFEPDYLGCKIFLDAVGYDMITPGLIGYHILSIRASNNLKSESWLSKQKLLYTNEWKKCIDLQIKRHPRRRKSAKTDVSTESESSGKVTSIIPKVKEEPNVNLSMELKSSCDENIAQK